MSFLARHTQILRERLFAGTNFGIGLAEKIIRQLLYSLVKMEENNYVYVCLIITIIKLLVVVAVVVEGGGGGRTV